MQNSMCPGGCIMLKNLAHHQRGCRVKNGMAHCIYIHATLSGAARILDRGGLQ